MLHVVIRLFYGPTQLVHWLLRRLYYFEQSLNSTSVWWASAVCTIMSNGYNTMTSIYKNWSYTNGKSVHISKTYSTDSKCPRASLGQACPKRATCVQSVKTGTLVTRLGHACHGNFPLPLTLVLTSALKLHTDNTDIVTGFVPMIAFILRFQLVWYPRRWPKAAHSGVGTAKSFGQKVKKVAAVACANEKHRGKFEARQGAAHRIIVERRSGSLAENLSSK